MPGVASSSWFRWYQMRNSPSANNSVRVVSLLARHKGLTLIELLVAISVLAFIAVLGWRGLDSIVRARMALNDDLEQTRGMQLTFAQLQSDCAHLASPTAISGRTSFVAEQGRMTLVRTVFADNQPSRLQVITYRVNDGLLTRRESVATRDLTELDNMRLAAANDIDTDQAVVLQSGVTELTARIWINGSWRAAIGALPPVVAPGTNTNIMMPTGLEITTQLQGREGKLLKIFLLGTV